MHLYCTMRHPIPYILILALTACGGDGVVVRGTLAEGDDGARRVWLVGGGIGSAVRDSVFEVTADSAGTLALRFADEDGDISRMELEDVAPGADLLLSGVWIARGEGLAFPTSVTGEGDDMIRVNGLRVAISEDGSGDVDLQGTVLAVGDDALLIRPHDESQADLRVVVTPGTSIRSPDEDPSEVDDLEFGDSVRVQGMTTSGYVVATNLVTPRRASLRSGESNDRESEDEDPAAWLNDIFGEPDDGPGNRGRGNGNGRGKGNGSG